MFAAPMPANCTEPITEPGAAAPTTPPWDRPASGSALALGTLSVGAPEVRWTQGGRELCVACAIRTAICVTPSVRSGKCVRVCRCMGRVSVRIGQVDLP